MSDTHVFDIKTIHESNFHQVINNIYNSNFLK